MGRKSRGALAWQGDESALIEDASNVRPGQTLVLPMSAKGWDELGHIPEGRPIDAGDRAAFAVRGSVSLRLHPAVMDEWPLMQESSQTPASRAVLEYARPKGAQRDEMERRLKEYLKELDANAKPWPYAFIDQLDQLRRRNLDSYPEQMVGYVLEARRSAEHQQDSTRVFLDRHLADVECATGEIATGLDEELKEPLRVAAKFHDYGKADVRYQAWLLGGDLMAAQFAPKPVAKSGNDLLRRQEAVGLPTGFRHELLSLLLAEKSAEVNSKARDLILHLISSHHGRCRPFAPVILDGGAECVSCGGISVCKQERVEKVPHQLSAQVADRFWRLTRQYGWWGLAYLEALLRLADWRASERETAEVSE